jgi:hypothetical protein
MAVNISKTKNITSHTPGKIVNISYNVVVFNNSKPGCPSLPDLITVTDSSGRYAASKI